MRYFLAALVAGPGRWEKFPVALLAVIAFSILGVLHSPLWFSGLLAAFLFALALANNERFRKVVDARRNAKTPVASIAADGYETTKAQIKIETRSRLKILERKREQIIQRQREAGIDDFVLDANHDALQHLLKIFATLLLTRQQLLTEDFETATERIERELAAARGQLEDKNNSDSERQSLQATIALSEQRIKILDERQQKVEELDGDLKRIEAHFDLALSQAGMREKPQGITSDISLASAGLHDEVMQDVSAQATTTQPIAPIVES